MEKRAIIAVGLSIAVFYLFSMLFAPEKRKEEPLASQKTTTAVNTQSSASLASVPIKSESAAPQSAFSALPLKDINVETDLYTAVFSARSASLKSLTLANYREQNTPTANKVTLGSDSDPTLFSFSTRAIGFNLPDSTLFMADTDRIRVEKNGTRQLTFNYVSGQW